MSESQGHLDFPDYPQSERYPNFDRDFIDLMLKLAVPERLGAVAFALLVYVVRTEDARRFVDAPTFWIRSLADRCGLHRNNFRKYLKACVDAGWLYWRKNKKEEIGVGWVLVPMAYRSMLKSSRSLGAEPMTRNVSCSVSSSVARSDACNVSSSVARNVAYSSLSPSAESLPHSQEGGRAGVGEDESELAKELKALGLRKPVEAARAGLSILTLQQIRAHLDHFRSHPGAWGPVIVYGRLVSPSLRLLGPDEGWPEPLSGYSAERQRVADGQRAVEQIQSREQEIEQLKSMKQMRLDFETTYGEELDAMADEQLAVIVNQDRVILEAVKQHTRRSSLVRPLLLRAMHEFFSQIKG